jgi:hypothetical protein
MVLLRKNALIKSLNLVLVFALPPLLALLIFSTYVFLVGNLTPALAFTTLSLFNTLRFEKKKHFFFGNIFSFIQISSYDVT